MAGALLIAGCGGDDDNGSGSDYKLRTTAFRSNAVREPGESGTQNVHACKVLRLDLKASPNDSLDLSICEWDARGKHVRLMVDTAPKAQLRYYNLLSEQHEYYNADPELKARQIKGVGEDSAYGGAGAWWTQAPRSRSISKPAVRRGLATQIHRSTPCSATSAPRSSRTNASRCSRR